MTHLKLFTVLCLFFAATTAWAAEDYYVWIDENGVVNYSEKNPPGYNARHITSARELDELRNDPNARRPGRRPNRQPDEAEEEQSEPTTAPENMARSPESGDEVDPDEIAAEERAEIEKQIAAVKRKNCEVGKRNLAQLQAYARIRIKDENGEERMLGDEEKQAKIAEAREVIRENCVR